MSNLNSMTEGILKNIIKYDISKVNKLKKIFEISLKIKEIVENAKYDELLESQEKDIIDDIADLADKRGEFIEEIKNINTSLRHYKEKLPKHYSSIIDDIEKKSKSKQNLVKNVQLPAWAVNLYKLLSEQQAILENIKSVDEKNDEIIKNLIVILNQKMKSIKNNRILMDKFNQANDMPAGSLFKSQK